MTCFAGYGRVKHRTRDQIAEEEARYQVSLLMRDMDRREAEQLVMLLFQANGKWSRVASTLKRKARDL